MIRIVSYDTPLDAYSLIGKLVMKNNAGLPWTAMSDPIRVSSVSIWNTLLGHDVSLTRVSHAEGFGQHRYMRNAFSDMTRTSKEMPVDKVRCICDTVEEVVELLNLAEMAQYAFTRLADEKLSELNAMNGREFEKGPLPDFPREWRPEST